MTLEQAPAEPLQMFHLRDQGEAIGTIGIPVRDQLSTFTTSSLMMTDLSNSWIPPDKSIYRSLVQGNNLVLARNELIQRMQGDWIVFIDDDMVWRPEALKDLVAAAQENDLDILGGLCFRRSAPFQPTLYMRESADEGAYNFLERWDTDIVEVDATGMAFIYISKRALETMAGTGMPSLEVRETLGPSKFFRWEGRLGEDLRFCQDAKAAGLRIFVDTRIEIGHVAEIVVSHKHFLTELAFRDPDLVEVRQKVNDAMDLPTVSPEEATAQIRKQRLYE